MSYPLKNYFRHDEIVSPLWLYDELTTTHGSTGSDKKFQITHPFHPLCGQWYSLVDIKQTWGEKRVYYYNAQNQLKSLLISWTSLQPPDLFITVSSGRSAFRTSDLLALVSLLKSVKENE